MLDFSEMDFEMLALAAISGTVSVENLNLNERPGDSCIVRIRDAVPAPIIAKFWNRPGWRGHIRNFTRTTPGHKEYQALTLLRKADVNVPNAIALTKLKRTCFSQVLFEEDLGECLPAIEHVKKLISCEREAALEVFLTEIVTMTMQMIEARVVDPDHSFVNIVATPSGDPARLDLELAICGAWRRVPTHIYGKMLGRLIGSYVFAVQPDLSRATSFAVMLSDTLNPQAKVLKIAERTIDAMLKKQKRIQGIESSFCPPWTWP